MTACRRQADAAAGLARGNDDINDWPPQIGPDDSERQQFGFGAGGGKDDRSARNGKHGAQAAAEVVKPGIKFDPLLRLGRDQPG